MKPTRPKTPGRKPPPPPPPPKPTPKSSTTVIRDPVEVYSRLRPLENQNEQVCIEPINSTTIRLTTPESSVTARNGNIKEMQYTFKFVFDENVSQKALFDHAALPLVNDLLHGKNGILFTYGVTGSGKTYTMTGTPQNGGIMPRCLDVVFNSIGELQAEKYVFKPDKMNGFDVQTKVDAMLDRQKDLNAISTPRTPRTPYRKEPEKAFDRVPDITKIDGVEDDNVFGVFVSYVEIYNNYVYDLLDDTPIDPIKPKPPQSKILREDGQHNMYVHGCIEVEVKSTEEAFDVFYKGQKRKRMAHTQLNTESSRSHSVFTIRLVQAPLDPQGEEVFQDKTAICISQLSLVDLAGSERTLRTKNTGDRLREAGNINNSLMVLRACMEVLRENQMQNANKMVPYRDSKLTHLFKNYFDGEGKVRMIVCINPSISDYDETIHVMRFAELTQEVQIARPHNVKFDLGLTPGRRRANRLFKEAVERIVNEGGNIEDFPVAAVPVIYSLGPPFPNYELLLASDETTLENFILFLGERVKSRRTLVTDLQQKQNNFRNMLLSVERENAIMKQEIIDLKAALDSKEQKLSYNERRLQSAENANSILQRKLQEYQKTKRNLEFELDEKDMLINRKKLENDKIKARMQDKLVNERGRITREMERRMREKQTELEAEVMKKSEKLRAVREIALNENWGPGEGCLRTAPSTPNLTLNRESKAIDARIAKLQASKSDPKLATNSEPAPFWTTPKTSVPVANPRHRRSRSGGEIWIEHRPPGSLVLDTILQPQIKKRKSVSKLDMKNITEDADRYCLVHQQQDGKGDIETQLYKGNVIPSAGGGAQVIFNDVEVLKQKSPPSATKKRSVDGVPRNSDGSSSEVTDVEDRCRLAVEGHKLGNKTKKQKR